MSIDLSQVHTLHNLERTIQTCSACDLRRMAYKVVLYRGIYKHRIFFIGEAPGAEEDQVGATFCGRAGQYLDRMTEECGFPCNDCYLGNVVKCKPFVDRIQQPPKEAIQACKYIMDKEMEILRPLLIVTLGLVAARHMLPFLGTNATMGGINGSVYTSDEYGIPVMCLYHPSYVIRSRMSRAHEDWVKMYRKMIALYKGLEKADGLSEYGTTERAPSTGATGSCTGAGTTEAGSAGAATEAGTTAGETRGGQTIAAPAPSPGPATAGGTTVQATINWGAGATTGTGASQKGAQEGKEEESQEGGGGAWP